MDRSPADLLNLELRSNLVYLEETAQALYERCRAAMATCDLIVITPWGVIPLQETRNGTGLQKRCRRG